MLSRIADSLFWMNRYMERNDCLTRIIRTNYILAFDSSTETNFDWLDVIKLCAHNASEELKDPAIALPYLVGDTKNLNSLKVLVSKARENARGVQDNITKEVWEHVNLLYHIVNEVNLEKKITGSRALEIIDRLDQNNTLYYGVTDNTMPRGQGWNFMNLGKFIERFILTIDTAHAHFSKIDYQLDNYDILYWRNLLLSLSGYELYLKKYIRGQHTMNVIDHIIFNKDFPRSLTYTLSRTKRYLKMITEDAETVESSQLEKSFGRIYSKVEFADMNSITEAGLSNFLQDLRRELIAFSNQLSRIYFSYS